MADLPPILAVFAHPDDEAFPTGGTLAHYARRGHRVYLACATRGEAGQLKDPALVVEDMGVWRTQELEASCQALGLEPPLFLGYRDSGRSERLRRDDPLALHNADLWEVEARIRALIAELQPQILITFDPHGGYGHPDHLVIHRATTAAFFSSGHLPKPPQRLFYSVFTSERAAAMQQSGQAHSILGGLDPQVFGVAENTLAVRMNVQAYLPQKWAAIQAHRSQFADRIAAMNASSQQQALMEQMLAVETFALGGTRGPIPRWPLQDLFDGL
ncbi:PIG-L deacetylase family protein [Meiothermus sp.]|uniref:PIG-L deacetylase family protein n=1 Tax=Meiothermus sp. TaxID=1955249 RepID=UPI0021DDC9FB|nr:PIG-L family deacetylase [Meiothermus sp.]GIW25415.1 MAG: PIG-L domain-containing protein [Meiothermus sp.]